MYANNDLFIPFQRYAEDHFPQTSPLRVAQSILLVCWSRETAHPEEAAAWTPTKPSIGQADVTAMAVANLLGGMIVEVRFGCGHLHFFNRVPGERGSHQLVDITRPDLPEHRPNARATTFRAMLTGRQSARARRGERYELLKTLIRQRMEADPLGNPLPPIAL